MKTPVRLFLTMVRHLFRRIRAASGPVKACITAELLTATLAAAVVGGWAWEWLDGLVALDDLPPWRLLAVFPVVGGAAAVLRARRPDETLRRWHGIALRRLDERFA